MIRMKSSFEMSGKMQGALCGIGSAHTVDLISKGARCLLMKAPSGGNGWKVIDKCVSETLGA
jgi:hypothetical protein